MGQEIQGTVRTPGHPERTPLVGRRAEITQLDQYLAAALSGQRQLVFVTGEPGIGKTALVDTFLSQIRPRSDIRIGYGQCIEQYGAGEAYLPLLEAGMRLCQEPGGEQLIAALRQHAPTWLIQLSSLLDATEREALQRQLHGATQERMLREATEAMTVLTRKQSFVLFLEDLHWCDVSTLEWLAYLAQRREPMRLLLIATYRPSEVLASQHPLRGLVQGLQAKSQCTLLSLSPLSERAVQEYLTDRFTPAAALEEMSQALHRRTGGNPLFMTNVVDYLSDQGLFSPEIGWTHQDNFAALETEVPQSLRMLIERQLERLDPESQQLLEVASVAGIEFSSATVAAGLQLEVEEVEQHCEILARKAQFLRSSGIEDWPDGTLSSQFVFLHTLYQNVVYERIPHTRRMRLHRRIGERIEAAYGSQVNDVAAELAVHFEAGRDYQRAIQYNERSAQTALRRYAAQEALTHLTTGLALLQHLPDTGEREAVELRLQTSLTVPLMLTKGAAAPETERAYTRARELCQHVGATPELFPVLYGMARFAAVRGDMPAAREFGAQLLQQATQADDVGLRIEAYAAFGTSLLHCGEFILAKEQFESGLALYNREQHHSLAFQYGDDPGIICQICTTWELWLLGYPDQARLSLEQVHLLATAHPYPLSTIGHCFGAALLAQFLKDSEGVHHWTDALETAASQQQLPYWLARAWILRGWQRAQSPEPDQSTQGLEQLQQGLAIYQQTQAKLQKTYFLALLAEAYLTREQIEEGLQTITQALALVAQTGERWWEAELYRLRGESLLAQESNRQHEAEDAFGQALAIARQQQAKSWELRAALSLSKLWQQQGKTTEARQLLEDVYGWFSEGFETQDLQEAEALLQALGSRIERNTRPKPAASSPAPPAVLPAEKPSPVLESLPTVHSPAVPSVPAPSPAPERADSAAIFRQEGDFWTLVFEGTVCRIKDSRGMQHLAQLLYHPNEDFHVLALAVGDTEPGAVAERVVSPRQAESADNEAFQTGFTDAGELLDPEARAAYRKRVRELQEELEEAQEFNDLGRVERLQEELDFLSRELSQAVGLGGRARKTGSAAERARSTITKAIKATIKRIAKNHPALGQHLSHTVRTGVFCRYSPDQRFPITWQR